MGENGAGNYFGDLRDDGVAEAAKSVHPRGYPMSHSTHVGFRAPLSSSGETIVRNFAREPAPPHLQRAAPSESVTLVGVGQSFT